MPTGFSFIFLIIFGAIALLGILGTIFWIWMLIDCILKESSSGNDKIVWLLVIIFLPVIGSCIYFALRRPQRIRELGQ